MSAPAWLTHALRSAGGQASGPRSYDARVRGGACSCGAPVLRGLDGGGDGTGQPADVDPVLLTAAGEAWALAVGRATYRLRGLIETTLNLHYRDAFLIKHCPVGSNDTSGIVRVVARHECGKEIPTQWCEE